MPIDIIAVMTPKPGKAARLQEIVLAAAEKVKANEPGTLKFHLQMETKGEAPTMILLESYKDKAAIAEHGKTEYFKEMGRLMKKEDLLAAPMRIMFTKEAGGYASKL